MKIVELFSGTASFSKRARMRGHECFTVDNNAEHNPDLVCDLSEEFNPLLWEKIAEADFIWMSPPCQTFSMAAGNTHWSADRTPKTKKGEIAKILVEKCKMVAMYCEENNIHYVIENPRARMRWFLPENTRHTVWYCQYGDTRAKPTDIWTNLPWFVSKQCKNNNPDCHHERAPRGSKTGTQGLKGNKERSEIPPRLCDEILDAWESHIF